MNALLAGVVKEAAPGERRVALTPDVVGALTKAGIDVLVEPGAGCRGLVRRRPVHQGRRHA